MSLVVTPGASDANSFAAVDEFKAYRDTRLPAISWAADASDGDIEVALKATARLLCACFQWNGTVPSETQALAFPRAGLFNRNGFAIPSNVNPTELKVAQCEWALQLGASDLMSDNDAAKQGVSSVRAGSVSVAFQTVDSSSVDAVDMLIRRMGPDLLYVSNAVPQAVRMLLVASWYATPGIRRPFVFRSVR